MKKRQKMARVVFVTGGARSGKSSFALLEASRIRGKKAFIATATASDSEMRDRIKRHRKDRGRSWDTIEEPVKIAEVLQEAGDHYGVIILDCLTLWLANLMADNLDAAEETDVLCSALSGLHCPLFVVSNEVGMGIVPENALARRFRDLAGRLNQRMAEVADEVYLTVAGIAVKIK